MSIYTKYRYTMSSFSLDLHRQTQCIKDGSQGLVIPTVYTRYGQRENHMYVRCHELYIYILYMFKYSFILGDIKTSRNETNIEKEDD